jgi:hypothetical protein
MRPRKSIFLVLCLAFVPSLFAAQQSSPPTQTPTDQELLTRYSPVEIADYRESIRQTFILGHELVGATKNPVAQKLVEQRMQMVDKLTDADVARLMSSGANFSLLHESMLSLREIVRTPAGTEGRSRAPLSSGFPNADYSFCGSVHQGAPGLLVALEVLDVAKGVWSAASRLCDQVAVVAGFGANTSLLCIVADAALTIAEGIFDGVMFCENDIDSNEINGSYRRLDHIHSDLSNLQSSSDSSQTAIVTNSNSNTTAIQGNDNANREAIIANDNANKAAIIANDNANKAAIVANDNVNAAGIMANDNANKAAIVANDNANAANIMANDNTNRTLIMNNDNANRDQIIANDNANRDMIIADAHRLAIEQSLATNAGTPLALFELPAPNGFIDLARSIVRQTIDNMKAANQNVFQAESFYTQAVNAISAGLFKDAFHQLQRSYQEAAK